MKVDKKEGVYNGGYKRNDVTIQQVCAFTKSQKSMEHTLKEGRRLVYGSKKERQEITGPGAGSGYDSIVWEYARGHCEGTGDRGKIPHAHLV